MTSKDPRLHMRQTPGVKCVQKRTAGADRLRESAEVKLLKAK